MGDLELKRDRVDFWNRIHRHCADTREVHAVRDERHVLTSDVAAAFRGLLRVPEKGIQIVFEVPDADRVVDDVGHRDAIGQEELVVGEIVRTIERHVGLACPRPDTRNRAEDTDAVRHAVRHDEGVRLCGHRADVPVGALERAFAVLGPAVMRVDVACLDGLRAVIMMRSSMVCAPSGAQTAASKSTKKRVFIEASDDMAAAGRPAITRSH